MKQEYIIGDWVMLNRRKAFVFESYIDRAIRARQKKQ